MTRRRRRWRLTWCLSLTLCQCLFCHCWGLFVPGEDVEWDGRRTDEWLSSRKPERTVRGHQQLSQTKTLKLLPGLRCVSVCVYAVLTHLRWTSQMKWPKAAFGSRSPQTVTLAELRKAAAGNRSESQVSNRTFCGTLFYMDHMVCCLGWTDRPQSHKSTPIPLIQYRQ